ncbi:MAG: YdcF family protein [Myxococcota bacterium]|nr:YdcF family protein [Myxococcota bacterium]
MRSVIVVFGSATLPNGQPGRSLTARLQRALREARLDRKAPIVVSGGPVLGPPEARVMQRWLVTRGVARERIVVEDQALFTLDNVSRVAPLIAGLKAAQVKLVTSPAHMQRSRTLLERELRCVIGHPVRVTERPSRDTQGAGEREREQQKLVRDLATQAARGCRPQSPKIVRAHA